MSKKDVLFSFVLAGVLFTASSFADATADLGQVESYVKNGMFGQAEELCRSVAQNNPGSDSALKAQGKLAVIYIMTQQMPQADAEVDKLISDFKGDAELPAILYGIANRYKQVNDSQRASNLSERICKEYPASEQAQRIHLDSGQEDILKSIADSQYKKAEEAVNAMIAASGTNSAMPAVLFKIAKEFKECGRYDDAIQVYQKIVQNYPNNEFGGKARMGIDKLKIWQLIKAGDAAGAQAILEKLIKDYKDEDDLARTVYGVALKFEKGGYYEQAKSLYSRVKQDYPNEEVADMATVALKSCDVRAMVGKAPYSTVKAEIDKLMSDFSGHRGLTKAVWRIAAEYYSQAELIEKQTSIEQADELYHNAAEVWDIVVNLLQRSSSTAEACACSYAAICHEKIGEYAKANECYQKVIDNHSNYHMRWNMIFMMGRNYERMKKAGIISGSEADNKTKAAYEKLLAEYPNCKVAGSARKWLGK